jgi:zinc transport system ATP-binding protein
MSKEDILQIKNVNFNFGKTQVLADVSLTVFAGDFLALIGPNGSGKTTLLKLILGIYPLQTGSINLCHYPLQKFQCWDKIGYVPQKATHFEEFFPASVEEVVSMGLISQKKFPKKLNPSDQQKIISALQTVEMEPYAVKRIGELSGGQKQRVFIARAIVANPQILFLDEPTTGVDQKTQTNFYELLHQLNQKGITIILVSHDIGRVTKYVTKIATLNKYLEFYGSHEQFCVWDKAHQHLPPQEHKLCLHSHSVNPDYPII